MLARIDPFVAQHRTRAIRLLQKNIEHGARDRDDAFAAARSLEENIYLLSIQQQVSYDRKVLEIAWNVLKNGSFLLDTYAPAVLVYLDSLKLAEHTDVAEWWARHNARIHDQRILFNEEAKFEEREQLSSGLTCNRCHSRLIAIQQQQIRSADEGMTVFCTCKKCGMRWKM